MYGWAPNGMGGLGDTCSDLAATWRSSMQNCTYDPDQNSACMQANTLFLADYLVAAQSAGCANPPMIGVIGPATDLGVAFAIDLVGHNVPDVQAVLPNATPAQIDTQANSWGQTMQTAMQSARVTQSSVQQYLSIVQPAITAASAPPPLPSTAQATAIAATTLGSNPTASVQDIATAVQAAAPTVDDTTALAAAQSAAVTAIQAISPVPVPVAQIQATVAANPTASVQDIAAALSPVPSTAAINPQILPSIVAAGGSIPTVDQTTGQVTPAATTATSTSTAKATTTAPAVPTTPVSWCFPGDTSAPFSSAVPVCSNTLLIGAGVLVVLLLLGGRG